MRIPVETSLWFTAGYNLVGMALAATECLPRIAAAQSVPDVAIMLHASRLLRR